METIEVTPLGDSFIYSRCIPADFQAQEQPFPSPKLLDINGRNKHLLHMINILEGHSLESEEEDEAIYQEIKRVEMKVDLLLLMMNKLIRSTHNYPPEVSLSLSAKGVRVDADSLAIGQHKLGILQLYLHPLVSEPVVFSVTVNRLKNNCVHLLFQGVNEGMNDAFEKYIFRQHRREIAGAKGL